MRRRRLAIILLTAIMLAFSACDLLPYVEDSPSPAFITLTCHNYYCPPYSTCASFAWTTRHANRVSIQSGYLEDGVFQPGGWHQEEDLPPNGSTAFELKSSNSLAQLCIDDPLTANGPICAICTPWE